MQNQKTFARRYRVRSGDNIRKFEDMFERRLSRGQFHYQPYLGCREFPGRVERYIGDPSPVRTETRDLGYMLHDIRFSGPQNEAVFFHAQLREHFRGSGVAGDAMILQSLREAAARDRLLQNPDYEPKEVAWIIALDPEGRS